MDSCLFEDSQAHRDMLELFTKVRAIKFFFQIIAVGFQAKYSENIDFTSSLVNIARLLFYVVVAIGLQPRKLLYLG